MVLCLDVPWVECSLLKTILEYPYFFFDNLMYIYNVFWSHPPHLTPSTSSRQFSFFPAYTLLVVVHTEQTECFSSGGDWCRTSKWSRGGSVGLLWGSWSYCSHSSHGRLHFLIAWPARMKPAMGTSDEEKFSRQAEHRCLGGMGHGPVVKGPRGSCRTTGSWALNRWEATPFTVLCWDENIWCFSLPRSHCRALSKRIQFSSVRL